MLWLEDIVVRVRTITFLELRCKDVKQTMVVQADESIDGARICPCLYGHQVGIAASRACRMLDNEAGLTSAVGSHRPGVMRSSAATGNGRNHPHHSGVMDAIMQATQANESTDTTGSTRECRGEATNQVCTAWGRLGSGRSPR